jgi:hypothetical protein
MCYLTMDMKPTDLLAPSRVARADGTCAPRLRARWSCSMHSESDSKVGTPRGDAEHVTVYCLHVHRSSVTHVCTHVRRHTRTFSVPCPRHFVGTERSE